MTTPSSLPSRHITAPAFPRPWTQAETQSAEKLTQILVDSGGDEFIGAGTRFDPKLFHAAGS